MPFSFTFKLSVPGLANPFSPAKAPYSSTSPPRVSGSLIDRGHNSPRRFASSVSKPPTPLSGLPISRKRGWEPTFAEPTRSTTSLTRGYLDTPYRQMALDEYQEAIASDTEMPPPAKRRRGLAGSIVDTALNAALIGTAVGLTMYRLWRDRGKGPERLPPPPPYQQGEWTPDHDKHQHQRQAALLQSQLPPPSPPDVTPTTSRNFRKGRHPGVSSSVGKRTAHRRTVRRTVVSHPHHLNQTQQHHQSYPSTSSASSSSTSAPPLFPPPQPEFDFEPEPVADDQMDWIGDKLSMLIQQGKQALSREVVVMSDAQEDEVDDGSGAWEEEDELRPDHHHHHHRHHHHHHRHNSNNDRDNDAASIRTSVSVSSSSSVKRARRPRSLTPAAPHFPQQQLQLQTPSPSPHKAGFECSPALALAMTPAATSAAGYKEETGGAWESPEIRESMEKARAKVLGMRMRGAGS